MIERPVARNGVSVVVPTLRESANLRRLAEAVRAALSGSGFEWELLLSDDDSQDGSEELVADLSRRLPIRLEIRRGQPRDLSLAVLDGIGLARFDRICVMDADLSHPPERIPDLLAKLDGACDLVVGSRYAPGGGIEGHWSRYRRLNSRVATLLARPLVCCSDPLSGFFAVDRRALPSREHLRPIGYKIGLELMVRGRLRVREVPFRFRDRSLGASKLNRREQLRFLVHLGRLYAFRFPALLRVLSFGLVGASGLAVDTSFYYGLQRLGLSHLVARFLSFWPAVSWNWWWNRIATFRDRPAAPPGGQWIRFAASSIAGLLVNFGSYWFLTGFVGFFAEERFLALITGVLIGSLLNFAAANRYVYGAKGARTR